MIGGFLKSLFGERKETSATEADPVEHKGYRIYPVPVSEGGKWRIAARIEREVGGETKIHHLIRADTLMTETEASEASVAKAKMMIDQSGDRIFD